MNLKERRKRFLAQWRSRQGLRTLGDLDRRDRYLYSCSIWLFRHGCTANRITLAGFIWTVLWMALYGYFGFFHPLLQLLCFIIPIGLSDLLDGSSARNNDDVTPEGTLGDHFRDLLYTLFLGFLAVKYGFEIYLFAAVVFIECVVLLLKGAAFVWYGGGYSWERFLEFSFDNFQHTYEDRWQSNFLYFGFPAYIIGMHYQLEALKQSGYGLIILSFGASFFVILKELRWTPIRPEKEK